jgi:hypothetical protein
MVRGLLVCTILCLYLFKFFHSGRVLELEIDQNGRARARVRTIYFPTRAGLAQDVSARAELELELELYCYLNEPISDRQYPLKIGSFTPLATVQNIKTIHLFHVLVQCYILCAYILLILLLLI